MKFEFTIPMTKNLIVSEANRSGEHWTKKRKRHKTQELLVNAYFSTNVLTEIYCEQEIKLPCVVKMTRIAPRRLDDEDNLRMSFKWIKDYLAGRIIPGCTSNGMKDSDKRVMWEYDQIKGKVREYAVKIEIRSTEWDRPDL